MAFNIGLSGIRAASTDLEVTGNNIANASTVGFKKSRAEFGDVYTTTLLGTGSKPVGSGVSVENVRQDFSQGNISGTQSVLDMAIDGNGYFVTSDRGNVSYTRAGIFSLDKEGWVVANNGSRLQGFSANDSGVVSGILGDMRIQVSNQQPRLTNMVNAQYNLNSGEKVLQEQGTSLVSNGMAIASAYSGIVQSTRTTLNSAGQPTTGGTPARAEFAGVTLPLAAGTAFDVDLGDGNGPRTVSLPAGATTLDQVQTAINQALGTQQLTARFTGGNMVLERAGYAATTGSGFLVSNYGALPAPVTTAGAPGTLLFVGSNPQTADFRSVPGTQTTTRTTATPPLNIVTANPGTSAQLTGGTVLTNMDFSGTNSLSFVLATETGGSVTISLNDTTVSAPPFGFTSNSVTPAEMLQVVQAQIAASGVNGTVTAALNGSGQLVFNGVNPGEYVQLANSPGSTYSLDTIGFNSANRFNGGTDPVLANNEFQIEVTSTTGNGAGPFTITVPPANYASLNDLATAIQQQMDIHMGAGGLFDKIKVEAVSGQLVFTNKFPGAGEGIAITPSAGAPQAVNALGFDSMFPVSGVNPVDRSNSFRINFTAPAPDNEQRSGSVLISLDEEYRSVQQLAASINRQLNAQDSDSYIGVQAQAVEIVPNVVPPQYKLEFRATKEGEASIISISNVIASGPDVNTSQLFGLLQVDPANGNLLTQGIEGVNNQYPAQSVVLTNPKGEKTDINIPARSEANEIVALFNMQAGVTASAETNLTIPLSSYNNPSNTMTLTVNGQKITATSLKDIAEEINEYRGTTLPGFRASVAANGDLVIHNQIGRDIKVSIDSNVPSDSLVVLGGENTGPVVLGGSATADRAAAVGGVVSFVFNEGYTLSEPSPAVSGIFGALTEDEFEPYTINAFDPLDQNTYNHATSMKIYDSLGNPHTMTQYFVKEPMDPLRPNEQNIWAMYVLIDGQEIGDPDTTLPFPQNLEPSRFRKELFFNQDGTLDEVATGKIFVTNWDPRDAQGNLTGAMGSVNVLEGGLPLTEPPSNSNFEISLSGSTQHNGNFDVNEQAQNGYATGRLTGLEIDNEGMIFARFTNGQAQVLGQVALATFRNPEGMTPLGDTAWAESFESGGPTIGSPRSATFGSIKSSSLEDSNVDLSDQLVRLIIAQRNFQASAKTISTTDEITQTILNI